MNSSCSTTSPAFAWAMPSSILRKRYRRSMTSSSETLSSKDLITIVVLVLDVFRRIRGRGRRRGRRRGRCSHFTFREFWAPPAIIALVRQSQCETSIEGFELCNWRVMTQVIFRLLSHDNAICHSVSDQYSTTAKNRSKVATDGSAGAGQPLGAFGQGMEMSTVCAAGSDERDTDARMHQRLPTVTFVCRRPIDSRWDLASGG